MFRSNSNCVVMSLVVGLVCVSISSNAESAPTIGNEGFESPNLGTGFAYTPAAPPWSFSASAGIKANGSGFGTPNAPEGTQTGLLQNAATISQTLGGFSPGQVYSITLDAAKRIGDPGTLRNNIQVDVAGQQLLGGRMANTSFNTYTTSNFIAGSTTPALTLRTTNPDAGDHTTFVDAVSVNSLGWIKTPTLNNASFESGPLNTTPGYGPVSGWSSDSQGTGSNDAGGPFLNGKSIPDGARVGFIQRNTGGITSLSQVITGLEAGKKYTLEYFENERGNGATNVARPSAVVDGNSLVAEQDVVSTGEWRRVRGTFTASGNSAVLALRNNIGTGDNTALFDSLSILGPVPVVADGGFENPVQPSNQFEQGNGTGGGSLAGSAWSIVGGAGITRNLSGFQNGTPAPEGGQFAIFQGNNASMTQTLTGLDKTAEYSLTLSTMARQGGSFGNDLEVVLDAGLASEIVLFDLPQVTFSAFSELTSLPFTADKSSYTLTLRASLDGGMLSGDRTTYVDDLRFNLVTAAVPEPSTWILAALAFGALTFATRRSRRANRRAA